MRRPGLVWFLLRYDRRQAHRVTEGPGVENRRLAVACRAAVVLAGSGAAGQVTVDEAWNAALDRSTVWLAGDIGHSIDLGDGRTLWLFGDSLVRSSMDDRVTMPRGAIGWHATDAQGLPPRAMQFAVPDEGFAIEAAEWITPAPGLFEDGTWYWLMGDGYMASDGRGGRRFVLFASAIGPAGNPDGMWNFRRVGGAILTVRNPQVAPCDWEAEQRRHPLVEPTHKFGQTPAESDNWGLAIVEWPGGEKCEKLLYVYGVRESGGDSRLLVARCVAEAIDRPEEWTFYDGRSWSSKPEDAASIAPGLVSEFTVQAIDRGGQHELVLIQSEPWMGRHIIARTARLPQGPWTAPKLIYEVSEVLNDKRLMTYAAKGHAHLSRPGELLVSYVLNSSEFGQIVREVQLYRPHFLRVPLELLPRAGDPEPP